MSTVQIEINSFISKLLQLNNYGYHADLHFNAFGGRIRVNMSADLGFDSCDGWRPSQYQECNRRRPNQSRRNRRLRRKQQRECTTDAAVNNCSSTVITEDAHSQFQTDAHTATHSLSLQSELSSEIEEPKSESFAESDDNTAAHCLSLNPEDEEPWTWTPPSEEDMLLYIQEHGRYIHVEENSPCDQNNLCDPPISSNGVTAVTQLKSKMIH